MPSPILFFIFVIVIDLILKSSKDRKKIKESRPSTPRPMEDLKKILDQELQRERQKQVSRDQTKRIKPKEDKPKVKVPREDLFDHRTPQRAPREVRRRESIAPREMAPKREGVKQVNMKEKELDIKRNILMGIVFSEILSEPKGVQNQRRSL